jgi:predicted ABC-type ATPase
VFSNHPVKTPPPTLYLFAGSNGAGKTTFARAYLRQLDPIPRFLNADEIARGLSPLDPQKLAVKAAKLLLHEIQGCLESGLSFSLESTLSGTTHTKLIQQAKSLGYQIELHYLWLPSPELAIRRIAQRVKMGGHDIPEADVRRRFTRSWMHLIQLYGPLADTWQVWDNRNKPPGLIMSSETSTLSQLEQSL